MDSRTWLSHSAEETLALGKRIAVSLRPPLVILLAGELGAGKATLAKGLISGLGVAREEDVTSPTFTLVHVFRNRFPVYHVDLYRVEGPHDLATLGLEDVFSEPAIVLIEWPEKLSLLSDWPLLRIYIDHEDAIRRRIHCAGSQWIDPLSSYATASNE